MSGLSIGKGMVEFCKGCMFDGWCKRLKCKSLHTSGTLKYEVRVKEEKKEEARDA